MILTERTLSYALRVLMTSRESTICSIRFQVGLNQNASWSRTTVGSFILAIELETGCSAGRSDRLYSGISTISSVVQFKGTYAGTGTSQDATLDFFAQFTVLLTLNMRQTGVWSLTI